MLRRISSVPQKPIVSFQTFQECAGIAGVGQRRIARFLRCQRLEAFGKRIPQRLNIVQTLFASRGRIANAQMPGRPQ